MGNIRPTTEWPLLHYEALSYKLSASSAVKNGIKRQSANPNVSRNTNLPGAYISGVRKSRPICFPVLLTELSFLAGTRLYSNILYLNISQHPCLEKVKKCFPLPLKHSVLMSYAIHSSKSKNVVFGIIEGFFKKKICFQCIFQII